MVFGPTQPITEMSTRNLLGAKGRPARMAGKLTASVSRLSIKCESLDVSQPYGLPRPVTRAALPFSFTTFDNYFTLKIKRPGGKVRSARRADNLAAIY
jgi:hypothetical protein